MHNHNGTTDFMKIATVLGFIILAVWWMSSVIGDDYTILVIFALVGVLIFAGGALFSHVNQKMTLDALTKFNAQDAKIDQFRQQSYRELAKGESAMNKAAAQLNVIDARRVDKLAAQQAKMLMDTSASYSTAEVDDEEVWTTESSFMGYDAAD